VKAEIPVTTRPISSFCSGMSVGRLRVLGLPVDVLQDEVGRTKGPQTADCKDGRWFADQTLSPNPDGLGRALREGLFNKQPLSADPPSRRERDTGLNQGHP